MSKFYAVKRGRNVGIFINWKETQKQISGFSGALYKSFKTENAAKDWLTPKQKNESTYDIIVNIYSDGSHKPKIGYLGMGAYCEYNGKKYEMSKECDTDMLKKYNIEETCCSNPTAEFLGFSEVLREFIYLQTDLSVKINFYIDYEGIPNFFDNMWQPKESYIKKIKEKCDDIIKTTNVTVKVHHIYGHGKDESPEHNRLNHEADRCATDIEEYNNFSDLRKVLENKLGNEKNFLNKKLETKQHMKTITFDYVEYNNNNNTVTITRKDYEKLKEIVNINVI